jgi:hypothetical protein
MTEAAIFGIINPLVIGLIVFIIVSKRLRKAKDKQQDWCERCKRIRPGMTKSQVTQILGSDYTPSYLQNGIEIMEYSWYIYLRAIRKISIKIKNDRVIEVNSTNLN